MAGRVQTGALGRLRRVFDGFDADSILIYNTGIVDSNFLYLTGFTSGIFERTALIAEPDGMTLITEALEYDTAVEQKPRSMDVVKVSGQDSLNAAIGKKLNGKVVGVNYEALPYAQFNRLKKHSGAKSFVDASAALAAARLIKEPDEIERIRKAVSIVKRSFAGISESFRAGMTELELAAEFDHLMRMHGASGPSFDTIVAFGRNDALPHHAPDSTRLKPNEFLLIDAGARHQRYCSDLTRTFIFRPDERSQRFRRMNDMIEVAKMAQRKALEAMKPGVDGRRIHAIAERIIDNASGGAYKGRFIHSLGHSIGIDVHDGAGLSPRYSNMLQPGMVMSDEPGIYITGFGGVRFEDDVLVEKDGARFM